MSATLTIPTKITVADHVLKQARDSVTPDVRGADLVLRLADGTHRVLPQALQQLLFDAMEKLATSGSVSLVQIPEELTSTAAAELLSVSRPTLMKWVDEGKLASFRVGTHTRFNREDVLQLRATRARGRMAAFRELRAIEAELEQSSGR